MTDTQAQPAQPPLPRSPERFSRETFEAVFNLTSAQPWLKGGSTALLELIDECSSADQQALICSLLHRFLVLDQEGFTSASQEIADHIQGTLSLLPLETYLVSLDDTGFSDSADYVIYAMKCAKWIAYDWQMTNFVKPRGKLLSLPPRKNVVLVDEFVGTGETASKAIKKLQGQLTEAGIQSTLYFAAVAGMEAGRERVASCIDNPYFVHTLKRGISDTVTQDKVEQAISNMLDLEKLLSSQGRRGTLSRHHLGYKKSESLYSRIGGNTPNNVFPVFWWESNSDGSPRNTLLTCM